MDSGYNSQLHVYKNELNGFSIVLSTNNRYSAEEIRFNLLAIGQRPLPILISQLNELNSLQSTLLSHLDDIIPDWNALAEFVPATDPQVDSNLLAKTIKQGDARDLLSLKKALDRDIIILKTRIIDEEEKISGYTVVHLTNLLILGICDSATE
jgi:hypothetical protein